tara:strand:+ start:1632 stop:1835 length:204 start_codon:yes stop_codon:yes gene_type:complete
MSKTFFVDYDRDGTLLNIPDELKSRIQKLKVLRSKGYTHIKDKYWTMYTGQRFAPISDYIKENVSYL